MNPEHPVYIVSKGRANTRLTSKALERMGVAYHIVVEPDEYDAYAAVIDPSKVLVLDGAYKDAYDTCDELGNRKGKGPGPARNFVWDHASARGASWHWVMDDNILRFDRWNHNKQVPMADGSGLRAMEAFVSRYQNVAMAGPNYESFVWHRARMAPIRFNTRIYSCNLIRNDVPYCWRGRYNEDTDLSLRMLKDGMCTILFNAFLQCKRATQEQAGGNTSEFYAMEGTQAKSEMLVSLHPDVARLTFEYGRPHHWVNYTVFRRNRLIRKLDAVVPEGIDNFGMVLQHNVNGEWITAEEPAA